MSTASIGMKIYDIAYSIYGLLNSLRNAQEPSGECASFTRVPIAQVYDVREGHSLGSLSSSQSRAKTLRSS